MKEMKDVLEYISQEIENETTLEIEKIRKLHEMESLTTKGAIIELLITLKTSDSLKFQTEKELALLIGAKTGSFNRNISELIEKGVIHRCGKKNLRNRTWTLGKQSKCKNLVKYKGEDHICCELMSDSQKALEKIIESESNEPTEEEINEIKQKILKRLAEKSIKTVEMKILDNGEVHELVAEGPCSCGHIDRTTIYSQHYKRNRTEEAMLRIAESRFSLKLCKECFAKKCKRDREDLAKERENQYKLSKQLAKDKKLPDLIGSPKQIKWAESIRGNVIRELEALRKEKDKTEYEELYNFIANYKSAKSWIDINQNGYGPEIEQLKKIKRAREEKILAIKQQKKREEVVRLRNLPYKEYLQTDHWKNTKAKKLKQAGYKCQICSKVDHGLNVHHNDYTRRGEERGSDLVVLCEACHGKFHDKITRKYEWA